MFTFTVHLDPFEQRMREIQADGERAIVDETQQATRVGLDYAEQFAKQSHQYTDRTSALTGSIDGRVLSYTETGAEGEVAAAAFYASYLEEGSPAHQIWPKEQGGVLAWPAGGPGGEMRYATHVNHPGTEARPFIAPAAEQAERFITERLETRLPRRLREILKGNK